MATPRPIHVPIVPTADNSNTKTLMTIAEITHRRRQVLGDSFCSMSLLLNGKYDLVFERGDRFHEISPVVPLTRKNMPKPVKTTITTGLKLFFIQLNKESSIAPERLGISR